jgi:hypothetical protein
LKCNCEGGLRPPSEKSPAVERWRYAATTFLICNRFAPRGIPSVKTAVFLFASAVVLACVRQPPVTSMVTPDPVDALTVELASARYVLGDYSDVRVLIDGLPVEVEPSFTDSVSAPGWPGPERRDSTPTATLARLLGARVLVAAPDTSTPAVPSARLLLSAPHITADTARITVTIHWYRDSRPRSGSGYQTVALALGRGAAGWRVIRTTDLGRT